MYQAVNLLGERSAIVNTTVFFFHVLCPALSEDNLTEVRTEMVWTKQRQNILRRGGKNTQKNYTKKFLTTQIISGVMTHLEPDILEVRSSGP